MLQWTRSGCGIETITDAIITESEKYAETEIEESEDSSVEELTTLNYDTKTEPNPPILTPTVSSLEAVMPSASPVLMKLIANEPTESSIDIPTEAPEVDQARFEMKKLNMKPIKPRLIDIGARKDDETVGILTEDTTPVPESFAEANDTNNGDFDEPTTIIPPPTKKLKIEIYKTRPNELLRHYVEDSHLRSPVAALIDKKTNPLSKAKRLWKAALKPNSLLDIMVVSYDSEGKSQLMTFHK